MSIRTLFRRAITAALLVCALAPGPAFAAESFDGKLSEVRGEVEIKKRGGEDWIKAYEGMTVGPGDQVSAGVDGHAILTLKDSKTELYPLSQFVVGRCVGTEKENYSELFLQVGKVASQVQQRPNVKNKFNVVTPTSVAGVRGTKMAVSHFPNLGTQVKISNGKGVVSPITAKAIPAPIGMLLGMPDAGKKEEKEEKKEKEKETEKAVEEVLTTTAEVTPEAAVQEFNEWLTKEDQTLVPADASLAKTTLLDAESLEFVVVVNDGQRIEITDAADPSAVTTPATTQQQDAQTNVAPEGLSPTELQTTTTTTEAVTAPEGVTQLEEQGGLSVANEVATEISTTLGGIPPSTSLVPPALPDRTGKTNITNK